MRLSGNVSAIKGGKVTVSFPKLVSMICGVLLLLGIGFGIGLVTSVYRIWPYGPLHTVFQDLREIRRSMATGPDKPLDSLQPSRRAGSGVTINTAPDQDSLVLISGFFDGGNQLRLVSRRGDVVASWPVSFHELFPRADHMPVAPATDLNIDIHGALMNSDGSVVFNFEYGGTVKLDRCGGVQWTLKHPTHHSIEPATGGGYWIPGRKWVSGAPESYLPPFTENWRGDFAEDLILHVSDDGRIEREISVPGLFYRSGTEALLTANGQSFGQGLNAWTDREIVHLNDIEELDSAMAPAFEGFEAGDLMLSLRTYNMILVVSAEGDDVRWHRVGPWIRQHDPEFNPDGTITIFNNNGYATVFDDYGQATKEVRTKSNILRVDPASGEVSVVFGDRPGQDMRSHIRGKHDVLPDGGLFVTEFEGGRVFETDERGDIVWEYINRYDDDYVAEVTEGKLYPASYFDVSDWSCAD